MGSNIVVYSKFTTGNYSITQERGQWPAFEDTLLPHLTLLIAEWFLVLIWKSVFESPFIVIKVLVKCIYKSMSTEWCIVAHNCRPVQKKTVFPSNFVLTVLHFTRPHCHTIPPEHKAAFKLFCAKGSYRVAFFHLRLVDYWREGIPVSLNVGCS